MKWRGKFLAIFRFGTDFEVLVVENKNIMMPDYIEKRNAVDNCMYGILWWLPKSIVDTELYGKIRTEVEALYDKAYESASPNSCE